MLKNRSIQTLTIDGGVLCLNFINTVYAWRGKNLHEYLGTYPEVLEWCAKIDLIDGKTLTALAKVAQENPEQAESALNEMKAVRQELYTIFSSVAAHEVQNLPTEPIKFINHYLAIALSKTRLEVKNNQLQVQLGDNSSDLLLPLWHVLQSTIDVLNSPQKEFIKECPSCGWLFLDQTKNKKRRWCSPVSCGSTDKAKRYYHNKKEKRS